MRPKAKFLALLLSMLMLLSLIAGCTDKSDPTTDDTQKPTTETEGTTSEDVPEAEPISITIGNWPIEGTEDYETNQGYIDTMKTLYPNITIETSEYGYNVNTFLPLAASGQLPTLYSTWFTETNKIIDAGYCADITDVVKSYGYDTAINSDMLALVTKDSNIYGLPSSAYSMGVYYNLNIFEEAGLLDDSGLPEFPTTYVELAETAQQIKEKTGKPGFYMLTSSNQGGWTFMNIAWSYGVTFEEKVDGKWKASFNSPEAVAALQYVKDLRWKYDCLQDNLLVTANDMFTAIGTDQVAMAYGTLDWLGAIIQATSMSKDDMAMSQVPAGTSGQIAQMGGNIYMFAPEATNQQIDACIKYLQVTGFTPIMDEAAQSALEQSCVDNDAKGYPVGPQGIRIWVDEAYNTARDSIIDKYTNVDMSLWNNYCENASLNIKAEEPVNCQELYALLDTVVQAVLTDETADPQALLDEAVATFQSEYLDKAE